MAESKKRPYEISEEERAAQLELKQEHELKRQKLGVSKSQYKKLLKQQKFDETKEEFRKVKKEKRKVAREKAKGKPKEKKPSKPIEQKKTDTKFFVDCEFDSLMNEKEIISLSSQITRMYSAKRHCEYDTGLVVSPFNERLKQRFDKSLSQYTAWKGIEFNESETLGDMVNDDNKQNFVYLTADTDETVDELQANNTYIIGGIVDKNRHKNLCADKAKELGIKIGRLPIDKYIKINGRQVLATSHVYEICCKWFEYRDWEKAFNEILPPRKLKKAEQGSELEEEEHQEEAEEEAEEESQQQSQEEEESPKTNSDTNSDQQIPEITTNDKK